MLVICEYCKSRILTGRLLRHLKTCSHYRLYLKRQMNQANKVVNETEELSNEKKISKTKKAKQ